MLIAVAKHYRLGACGPLAACGVVIRRDMLEAVRSATALLERAEAESGRVLATARDEAEGLLRGGRDEGAALAFEAQQAVWGEARHLLDQLRGQREAMLSAAGSMLAQLARGGLERLLLDVPAGWAPASSIRLVLREWRAERGGDEAVLRVHPLDFASLPAELRAGPRWRCVADAQVADGGCVLSVRGVDFSAHYTASVRSLIASMGQCDRRDFFEESV
ncbi:HrpE/YscL family type III secretion apparatus protein [Duganella violaceipulchra]|uniref:Flagellar biosynthesis/type III secretory pathway protein FliH n=1 Tax=Duganella violaceipulchra TaxID=2849652 RepID=A0AA41L8Q7_9BURK|nr:HrpE/YscL family type III secretion apparatus protein [Duganella violaceicalia]MBV6322450.1 hypothetical protein [Duganella violaceicalia]MCP2010655.1 flagellar biosynthesis/type III secretory pathway protein FliH [Duganella violaceicalia]